MPGVDEVVHEDAQVRRNEIGGVLQGRHGQIRETVAVEVAHEGKVAVDAGVLQRHVNVVHHVAVVVAGPFDPRGVRTQPVRL